MPPSQLRSFCFQQFGCSEELDTVGWRALPSGLINFAVTQCRDVMHLTVQDPRCLLRRQAGRQLAQ